MNQEVQGGKSKWQSLILLKFRFLGTSIIATGIDIGLYLLLYYQFGCSILVAQSIAYPIAVLAKFFLEKYFVFDSNRKVQHTFFLAMLVSGIGYVLSLILVYFLNEIAFLHTYQLLLKLIEKGILFFYNFYFKRFAFEKKFL
ncbi:MAG: GtrA family protein [Bacteroidota bacterium]